MTKVAEYSNRRANDEKFIMNGDIDIKIKSVNRLFGESLII